MWNHLQDLKYNPVKLRGEFLSYHAGYPLVARPDIGLDKITDEYSLIREALTQGDGIVFGEEHFDNVSAAFLIDNMEIFESLGVDTLFFEGLLYGLERGVDGARDESESVHPEYSRLIESAKKHGLNIVGLDSKGCKRGDGITRGIFMNAHAGQIINTTPKKKWIALTGMMHLEGGLFIDSVTMRKYKVHGLADFTGATSIILHAIEAPENKYIKYKMPFLAWPAKRVTPDFIAGIYSYKHVSEYFRGKVLINPVEELYQFIKDDGWKISHYDIDTYAKYHVKSGYLRGAVFSFTNDNATPELFSALKRNLDEGYVSFYNDNNSWFHIAIDQKELIFSCNFETIEYAAQSAKESLLNRELVEQLS